MDSERDDVELSSTAEYTLSQACRFKAERDQLRQRVDALEEWSDDVESMYRDAFNKLMDETKKANRLGKLVWRLQNRLARAHRREKAMRKGMREWREKAIGAPVRTMSAYDLLPEEDLQTLRWVREQGGLDVVKTHAELFQQLKFERDEYRELVRGYEKHGAVGLALEYLRILNGVCKRLGLTDGTGKPEQDGVIYEAIERRLMPEGYEWPRYKSGEPVQFGDDFERYGDENVVSTVTMYQDGSFTLNFCAYSKGERVNRAAVPAGDGKPLREGETVYLTDSPTAFVVDDIMTREDGATVVHLKDGAWNLPQYLTHERPDSWERIKADAATFVGHVTCRDMRREDAAETLREMMRLLYRCKALAERGE